jgi:hypothetical protein
MTYQVCKWKNDADSPVLFMVDDLTNVWIDTNGNGRIDLGEDWGYAREGPNSSFRYLNEQLLNLFPEVKTTFFTPVCTRAGLIENSPIKRIALPINYNQETIDFFSAVHREPKFEIAYHGTTHGKAGESAQRFQQEWEIFHSVPEAEETISYGKEIYKEVFGEDPRGGKYCGYVSNQYSDESIDRTGFLWWCRYWNRGLFSNKNCRIGGTDLNPLTAFDIKFFGLQNVVDIPSTLSGDFFTSLLNLQPGSLKNMAKKLMRRVLIRNKFQEIAFLLKNKLVISIQEHIAPARDDGIRQQPNIYDDTASLKMIFDYLHTQNVWYCTGTELAEYVLLRNNLQLITTDPHKFVLVNKESKDLSTGEITVKITGFASKYIVAPDSRKFGIKKCTANIPVQNGEYQIL